MILKYLGIIVLTVFLITPAWSQTKMCMGNRCFEIPVGEKRTINVGAVSARKPNTTKNSVSKKLGSRKGIRPHTERYTQKQSKTLKKVAPKMPAGVGTTGSQLKQNYIGDTFALPSLVNESGREQFIKERRLFEMKTRTKNGDGLVIILERSGENYLYPFAAAFFYDAGRITKKYLASNIVLTSMWRSEEIQKRKGKAPTHGITASTHPLATTADAGNKSNNAKVKLFFDRIAPRLEKLPSVYKNINGKSLGVVEILRESTCRHIMVFPEYNDITRNIVIAIMIEEAKKLAAEFKAKPKKNSPLPRKPSGKKRR